MRRLVGSVLLTINGRYPHHARGGRATPSLSLNIMGSCSLDNRLPYQRIARWYDAIYAGRGRDPASEIEHLALHWTDDGLTEGTRRLLDAGCGTGVHLPFLARHGAVVGVDLSEDMIAFARGAFPDVELHVADVRDMDLGHRFDVVTSLFGAMGYFPDPRELRSGLAGLGRHVADGGVLLVEPPLLAEHAGEPRKQHLETAFDGGTLVREATSRIEGDVLEIDFTWQCHAAGGGLSEEVRERHRLLLLDSQGWLDVMRDALPDGTHVEVEHQGPIGRGLLVAHINRDGARGTG